MDFSPAIYEHAAKLIGKTPWEVSRDPELLFRAHAAAFRTYRHRPVVVGIDIYNFEAEAYGAEIARPEGTGIPAVTRHICDSAADICALPPFDPRAAGRIPADIAAARRLAAEFPDADVRIPVSGPFSIASSLVGFENLLCEAITDPDALKVALDRLALNQIQLCRHIHSAGLLVSLFESAATPPMISPATFRAVELPALSSIMSEVTRLTGRAPSCVMGGNTCPILDALLEANPGFLICPPETDQAAFMQIMRDHPDVAVRINMNPRILVSGDLPGIFREIDRLVALAAGRPNTCLGAGAIPYEADPHVVLQAMDYSRRRSADQAV